MLYYIVQKICVYTRKFQFINIPHYRSIWYFKFQLDFLFFVFCFNYLTITFFPFLI